VENALIKKVDLIMTEYGCAQIYIALDGGGWCCVYGGFCLGHGYLGADHFDGSEASLPYIMRIMDTVGVERFNDMKGKYVRVATKGLGCSLNIIGNIIEDKWFDQESFFKGEAQ
jgi:hypothetical protein